MRRVASDQHILLHRIELDCIHVRQCLECRLHFLLVPRRCLGKGNGDPFNGSTQQIHEIRNLVGAIDDGRARQPDNLAVGGLVHCIVESAGNLGGIDDTRNQVMNLVDNDHAIVERILGERPFGVGFRNKGINVLAGQTVVVDKIEALSDDILNLALDDILSRLGQVLVVRVLARHSHEKLAIPVQESIGDGQCLGLGSGLLIQCLLTPVLLKGVDRVAALSQLRPIVLLKGGRSQHIHLLVAHQRLGNGDGRARLAGPQTVIQQNATIRCLDHQVLANQLLVWKHLTGIRLFQAQVGILVFGVEGVTVFFAILEKDASNVVRERFPVREDERWGGHYLVVR